MRTVPIDQLRTIVYFDGKDLRWKKDIGRWGRTKAGTIATGVRKCDGYAFLSFPGGQLIAHRVIWAIVHGAWPDGILDHVNGIRTDNRIENLREISDTGNAENKHGPQRNNSHGFMGVTIHPGGWFRARIHVRGKTHHIGLFRTPEEAHTAYLATKRILHEHCSI